MEKLLRLMLVKAFSPMVVRGVLFALVISNSLHIYGGVNSIGYESSQLLNQSESEGFKSKDERGPVHNWLVWSFEGDSKSDTLERKLSGELQYNQYDGDLVYSLPEFFVQYKNRNGFRASFGRQTLDWNPLEKFWLLGEINPLQGIYLMDSTQEGLTGVQLDYPIGNFTGSLFVSYLYVPQANPGHSVEDGKVTTNSKWSGLPPSATMINGNLVPIYYTLAPTSVGDVIWQQSLGMRIKYGWHRGEFSAFGLYKPENRLRMRGDAYYDQFEESVIVNVEPLVNHQLIYGLHGKQRMGQLTLQGAVMVVDPNAKVTADLLVLDPIRLERNDRTVNSQYFTIAPKYLKQHFAMFDLTFQRRGWQLGVSSIKQLEAQPATSDDFYGERSRWQSAIGGHASLAWEKINVSANLRYDLDYQVNLLSLQAEYQLIKQLKLSVKLEMIEVGSDESYWSAYRTNDVAYSRITYLF